MDAAATQQYSDERPEKRCRLGGPAVREKERPEKEGPERPPKEDPLPLTKLLSLNGNSSPSSDVSLWLAANVCRHPTCHFRTTLRMLKSVIECMSSFLGLQYAQPQAFAGQLVGLARIASILQRLMRREKGGMHLDHVAALVHELGEVADGCSTALHSRPCLGEGTPALFPPPRGLCHLHPHLPLMDQSLAMSVRCTQHSDFDHVSTAS